MGNFRWLMVRFAKYVPPTLIPIKANGSMLKVYLIFYSAHAGTVVNNLRYTVNKMLIILLVRSWPF